MSGANQFDLDSEDEEGAMAVGPRPGTARSMAPRRPPSAIGRPVEVCRL